jgi:hypothetical protein
MTIQMPTGFTARPATPDDLQTVVDVINAVTQADVCKSDATLFTIGRYWQGLDLKLETDTLLIFSSNGQPAGCALFMEDTPPVPCMIDTWCIRRLSGRASAALLQWSDQRAKQALQHASRCAGGVGASVYAQTDRHSSAWRNSVIRASALLSHGDRVRFSST